MAVVRDAAVTDPDMAAQWATNEEQRVTAFHTFAQLLADRHALNPDYEARRPTCISACSASSSTCC